MKGAIGSVEAVRQEVTAGTGHLAQWAAQAPSTFWMKPDAATPASMAQLSTWAADPQRPYTPAALDEFFRVAEYYLITQAHSGGHSVMTFELPSPQAKKRVLIPDACRAMNVHYLEPFSAYRRRGLRF